MGVAFTQRPDLFNAVVCQVPLLDMLNYANYSKGSSWIGEFGDPKDPKMRKVLMSYSPFHNLKRGTKYPEVFFWTSTKDDRVHPFHARKMVAKMKSFNMPVLYFENIEGGHGGGADKLQYARIKALEYTYLLQKLAD